MRSIFIFTLIIGMALNVQARNTLGSIQGIVFGATQWDINKLIDKIETIVPQNESEFINILQNEGKPYQINKRLAGVTVVLHGKFGDIESVTDSKGNFNFKNIPLGVYTISVDIPNCPGIVDSNKKVATCQETVVLNVHHQNKVIYLKPDLFRINIQGRVTTENGEPIAGAIVKAKKHFALSYRHLEETESPIWVAVTDKNGEYILKNLPATNYLRLAGHLLSPKRSLDNVVEIEVSSPGYSMQGNAVKIPLVCEENLFIARRFSKIIVNIEKNSRGNTVTERKGLNFPKSLKNVIFGVNFILTKE